MPRPKIDLPEADEPLDTPDGPIEPEYALTRRVVEVPNNQQAVQLVEGTRRKLADLPVTPRHLNPIACVCFYTMFGLDSQEIGVATGLGLDQINKIRMTNEYAIMQTAVVDAVLQSETGEVKGFIQKSAFTAAKRVNDLVHSSNSDVSLRAAKDVLDRAGLRPADVVEHRSRMDMGLVIEFVDRRADEGRPIIDMDKE